MVQLLLALAALAALYDSKILVWDIAVADLRAGSGGWPTVVFALLVSAGFVLLPLYLGLRARQKRIAILIAGGSILLSILGFVVLSAAFTP